MQIPHDLFRTAALNHNDKMVLLSIIDVGRSDMPNRWNALDADTMHRRIGLSRATCYRSIRSLNTLGVVKVRPKYGRTNEYQIQWDALDALVEAAEIVSQGDDSVSHRDSTVSHRESSVSHRAPKKKSSSRSSEDTYGEESASPRSTDWWTEDDREDMTW